MESHQQQQQQQGNDQEGAGKSYLCRQSSSRWTPTTDQIRILKELYYNNGVRSPTAEQIQRISAKLRQYGKIEGKNVFYWFQNHKARERQKKRFTTTAGVWKNEDVCSIHHSNKFTNMIPPPGNFPSSSTSSTGLLNVGSVGNYGYGSVAMERSFRECSITPPPGGNGSSGAHNFAWIGVDPYSTATVPYPFLEKRRYFNGEMQYQTLEFDDQELADQEEGEEGPHEIETLPLFPMHGDDTTCLKQQDYYFSNRLSDQDSMINGARASLELTLNSYSAAFPTSL